jgi:hypothetical protein
MLGVCKNYTTSLTFLFFMRRKSPRLLSSERVISSSQGRYLHSTQQTEEQQCPQRDSILVHHNYIIVTEYTSN